MSFPYLVNDVVLARVPNGKIYYTKIRSISHARKECVAEFDDGSVATVDWTNIFDVAAETDVIVCVVCKQGDSETPNEIILCDTCNVGYHQECHPSRITDQHIAQEKWHCHYCLSQGPNPYVTNPFENSRSRSPSKRKRKLVKSPPKLKANPKKRRKVGRPSLKSSKSTKSYVAKKCTVSIVKQSIQELESVVPYSDVSNSSLEITALSTPPQGGAETVPTLPAPLPLPHRPVNAVQPLNHSMTYPVCSPPPLQMSPLVKKPPCVQSCSPPPLTAPRDVTINHDAIMTSLPPLQKARDADRDPLRNIADCPSSSWTSNSLPSSKLKKSPVCETHPVQPTDSVQEPPNTLDESETTNPKPPSPSQPPQLPPVDSIGNISSDQIRGLYLRLYDFLQQTRAQGNPVIDREVVQHLISYGNDQIQKLSTSGSTSNLEQIDEMIASSTASQITSLRTTDNVIGYDTLSTLKERVASTSKNHTKEIEKQDSFERQKCDSKADFVAADMAAIPTADVKTESASSSLNLCQASKKQEEVGSPKVLADPKNDDVINSSEKEVTTFENASQVSDPLSSFVQDPHPVSTTRLKKSSQIPESTVEIPTEPIEDSDDDLKRSASSEESTKSTIATETSKAGSKSNSISKLVSQPLDPINSQDLMGPFIENIKKRTTKKKTDRIDTLPCERHDSATAKTDSMKRQCKKKKDAKKSTTSVLPRKRSKLDPPTVPTYSAVQAGNSVIITPNSASDVTAENSVPVQFITEVDAPIHTDSSDELSKIFAEYSSQDDEIVNTAPQIALEGEPLPVPTKLTQPEDLAHPATKIIKPSISSNPTPTRGEDCTVEQRSHDEPLSACLPHAPANTQSDVKSTSNHETFPKTSASSLSTLSTPGQTEDFCEKNNTSTVKPKTAEPNKITPKLEDAIKTDSQSLPHFAVKPNQHSGEQSALKPVATPNLPLNDSQADEKATSKPRLRNSVAPTSDIKRTSTSDRSNLNRESKNQARDNIKSFTIFDSYSSLFDSDDDDDDVFVTQRPSSQLSCAPNTHVSTPSTSQHRVKLGENSKITNFPDDAAKSANSNQISSSIMTTTTVPDSTLGLSQVPPAFSAPCLDDLVDSPDLQVPASTAGLSTVSLSDTQPGLVSTTEAIMSPLVTTSSVNARTPSDACITKTSSALSSDDNLETARFEVKPTASPPSNTPNSSSDPVKCVARHIQQTFSQMLLVATVRRTSELAVEAAVIRLEEGWTSLNLLSATLLHGLATAVIRDNKMRIPVPVTSSHNLCSNAVSSSTDLPSFITSPLLAPTSCTASSAQNISPIPVINSQNLSSVPVINSQNLSSVPVINSQNLSSVPVINSQNLSSVPVINSQNLSSVPVINSQNLSSGPVINSQNLSPVPVINSQNLSPVPVINSQNRPPVPVMDSQNHSSVAVINSQNLCSIPIDSTSTQIRAGKLARTNSSDENSAPNKNNISGQCYNCYSPALIACRRCANALYCSLRCELEHLAIHRRECCKRQS